MSQLIRSTVLGYTLQKGKVMIKMRCIWIGLKAPSTMLSLHMCVCAAVFLQYFILCFQLFFENVGTVKLKVKVGYKIVKSSPQYKFRA